MVLYHRLVHLLQRPYMMSAFSVYRFRLITEYYHLNYWTFKTHLDIKINQNKDNCLLLYVKHF